jgi:hypothetical protein
MHFQVKFVSLVEMNTVTMVAVNAQRYQQNIINRIPMVSSRVGPSTTTTVTTPNDHRTMHHEFNIKRTGIIDETTMNCTGLTAMIRGQHRMSVLPRVSQ